MGGTFTLEKIVLAENTEPFELDICRCDPRLITQTNCELYILASPFNIY